VASPYLIDEWNLTFTQGVGFTTAYSRRITISNALQTGQINWGPGSGMVARDNNRLIVSRFSTASTNIPTDIVELNISQPGNITLTNANVTTLFTLPAIGANININDIPVGTLNNPINISQKIIVSGGMTLTENQRLIIKCKLGANPAGTVDHILLQYQLNGTLEHARRLDSIGLDIAISSAVFSYDGVVIIERTTGANPAGWSLLNYNGTPTPMTSALGTQSVPLLLPGQYSLTGPMGASSPIRLGGDLVCPTNDLPINVTSIT
jgi:hypothetical protein